MDQCYLLLSTTKLVVTAQDPVPLEICNDVVLLRMDLYSYNTRRSRCHYRSTGSEITNSLLSIRTLDMLPDHVWYEEADVIILQQVVKLLIHYSAQEHLTCDLSICGTSSHGVNDIKATTEKHSTNIAFFYSLISIFYFEIRLVLFLLWLSWWSLISFCAYS